jgi:hypothetical protein
MMKTKGKTLTALITAFALITALFIPVSAVNYGEENQNKPTKTYTQKFGDVASGHWAFSYVGEMVERGVLDGYPDGRFYPENTVTRAEFAKIMAVTAGLSINTSYIEKYFNDTAASDWYTPYINAAKSYLSGYSTANGNYYYPNQPALREDIAVALVKLKGYDTAGADESILSTMFTDVSSISSDAKRYIATAIERGLVSGYDDRTFRGQESITRAEAAAMLWRAYQYGNDNKQFDAAPTPTTTPIEEDDDWKLGDPEPTQKPVVTASPTAKPTAKPTEKPTPSPTVKPTATPEPTPTPEPEKPYVIDTVTKANISNTWNMMTSDNDGNLYYYDKDDDAVYKIDMNSEKKTMLLDVSNLELREDGKFDDEVTVDTTPTPEPAEENLSNFEEGEQENPIIEHYKNFSVDRLYYDETTDGLILTGYFENITDYYGLNDKKVHHYATIKVADTCSVCSKDEVGSPLALEGYNDELGFKITSGSNRYKFSKHISSDSGELRRYDFVSDDWEFLRYSKPVGSRMGYYNSSFYVWNDDGTITKCELNTKLTKLSIDTSTNVDVLDFQSIPKPSHYYDEATQIFLNDENTIYFYDTRGSIRVIKER